MSQKLVPGLYNLSRKWFCYKVVCRLLLAVLVKREKGRAFQKELPGCMDIGDVGSFQKQYLNELLGSITLSLFATFLDFN